MNMGTKIVALGDECMLIPAAGKSLIEKCRDERLTVFDPDVSIIAAGGWLRSLLVPTSATRCSARQRVGPRR